MAHRVDDAASLGDGVQTRGIRRRSGFARRGVTIENCALRDGHSDRTRRPLPRSLNLSLIHISQFYDIEHVLVMGRVTSGEGGVRLLERAKEVLEAEFPDLAGKVELSIPDESSRRVGQSIAAASLPEIRR